jgi:cytochrome c oxidase cbb3-type subunit 3
MRTFIPKLLMIQWIVVFALPAMAGDPGTVKSPGPEQLMGVHVGETEIPYTSEPKELQNPYENDSRAVAQGQMLFSAMNCIGCHAPLGGGGMGPPLSDNIWIYGSEPGQVYLSIVQGRPNGMPAFSKALPPNAIWQLVSYVRSLSTDSPGEPVDELPKTQRSGK